MTLLVDMDPNANWRMSTFIRSLDQQAANNHNYFWTKSDFWNLNKEPVSGDIKKGRYIQLFLFHVHTFCTYLLV